MATACERVDELVKEYLLYRGFTGTAKAFDHEVKHDKDRGLRADKIVDQLIAYVGCHDLQHFREYWAYLNQRFFSRLEQRYASSVRRLEVSLLKLYVVNAYQSNRQDRVREFFEKIGAELQNQMEFRDWFVFPFVSNPMENGNFSLYFTRQWQETLQLSLHNFLQVMLQAMPVPTLLNFDHDARRMLALQEEIEAMKNQVHCGAAAEKKTYHARPTEQSSIPQPLPDLIYDFSGLADGTHEGETETVTERQKTSRRFPINLSAPLLKRNKQPDTRHDTAAAAAGITQPGSHGNLSSNNTTMEPYSYQIVQPGLPGSAVHTTTHGPGAGMTYASAPSMAAPAGMVGSTGPPGLRSNIVRSIGEPQTAAPSVPGQPPGAVEGAANAGARKKGPRELTSFPPYTSPLSEKTEPLPARTSSLAAAPERPPGHGQGEKGVRSSSLAAALERPQGHVLGDKSAVLTEVSIQEETGPRESRSSSGPLDYGPVESLLSMPEGKQCPFLVLSDDEYLEHQSAVCYSRFSLSGQHVASLDADGIVKVWTWSPQPSTTATVMSRAPFLSLDWASKSDRWLLLGNQSGQIRLFDTREIKTFREASVESPNLRVTYLTTCPSTMTFASCLSAGDPSMEGGKLALWDLKTMKMERCLPIEPQPVSVSCCVHSSNGKLLLAAGMDGVVRLYDVGQRQCVKSWRVSKGPQQTVQFAQQDSSFFSMGSDGMLSEWSLMQTTQPVRQIGMLEGAGSVVSRQVGQSGGPASGQLFSLNKDKAYLLCGTHRQGIVCKVGEGQAKGGMLRILDLSVHTDAVTTVDWSPCIDTPVCLTGSRDGHVKVATLLSQ